MSSAIQSTVIEYLGLRNKYPIQISQDDVNLFIRLKWIILGKYLDHNVINNNVRTR